MADIIQETFGNLLPSGDGLNFSMPQINPWDLAIAVEVAFLVVMIIAVVHIWRTYKIKILEMEDRGRGSLRGRILWAKEIFENGIPKYQVLGHKKDGKPLKINASESDNKIPLRAFMGFYKDIIIMHKDKNGDYRPYKVITEKEQVDVNKYINKETKLFKVHEFLDDMFPLLKIDNLKMRAWYALMTKETMNLYKEKGEFIKKYGNMLFIILIGFAVCVGVYYFLM